MKNEKLEEFENNIKSKKVAIIGLGVSNIPLVDYLYKLGAKVSIFDNRLAEELAEELIKKIEEYNFEYIGGENNLEKLIGFDYIFRSPSCLPTNKNIEEEVKRGAIITTEIEMLIKLSPCKIIGVTGTEGKTTTSSIIYAIINEAGYKCHLGGNIGNPIFTNLVDIDKDDLIVLEMSSFQLMGMDVSPNYSLVTNIYPDHLNIHKDMEEYINSKKNIFTHQNSEDIIVLNYDNNITREFNKDAKCNVIYFSSIENLENGYIYDRNSGNIIYSKEGNTKTIINKQDIKLRGVHNYENICAALAITSNLTNIETQIKAIKKFKGVEHRLEFVKEIDGTRYYNDSIATSPASTIAGLNAFDENIILIAGGSDKGLDYKEIGEKIANKVGTLILCGPTSEAIEKATRNALKDKQMNIIYVSNMKEAVIKAKQNSKPNDIVLLSPASASFDLYKNFAERGNLFKKIVNEI